ncbi:MAG: PilC/PilY family type IV pilus protein [Candidatus Dactylopiibacterium sp.]|nr:PilC/PilY family type IV pilus protein [Candidatus Dactylopiibacterium sp.]
MRPLFSLTPLCAALLASLSCGAVVAAVKIADVPLDVSLNSANSVLAVDNSGSMDFELLINGADQGLAKLPPDKTSNSNRYAYMFPMAVEDDYDGDRNFYDYGNIPPFQAYAYFRSPSVNTLFYNPKITYDPWPDATIGGNAVSFPQSPVTAARTHPYFTQGRDNSGGTATTFDLTATYFGNTTTAVTSCSDIPNTASARNSTWTFLVKDGMSIDSTVQPSGTGTSYPVCFRTTPRNGNWSEKGSWKSVASASTNEINGGIARTDLDVMVPYNPATFWMPDSTCTASWPACATDPSGTRYKRFDINSLTGSSYTLPDGTVIARSKQQELQNFANWFTYYRKRKTMMAGGMGKAFDSLQRNFRQFGAGVMTYHDSAAISANSPKIYDFTTTTAANNGRALAGLLYALHSEGGTPTIGTLDKAGQVYGYSGPFNNFLINKSSTDAITDQTSAEARLRCSANTAFILTDGYGNDYDTTRSSIYAKAKAYYDDLRWWKPSSGSIGKTMNTYGITLGALGSAYLGNPDATPPSNWPTPSNDDATSIDDLWRATLYSKGKLLSATDPTTLEASINAIITSMFASGTGSGLAYSGTQISTSNNMVIKAGYDSGDWTGELAAFSVHTTGTKAGYINYDDKKWSARDQLDTNTARVIATWSGSAGIPFTSTALNTASLLSAFNTGANNDGANVVAWLRGDRSLEGTTYRKRTHLLGDIVNATPAFVNEAFATYSYPGYSTFAASVKSRTDMVYVGANDGMLHAFRASDGKEMWAYVPKGVHSKLNALAQPGYTHQFTVDGNLTAWDVQFTQSSSSSAAADGNNSSWKTVLIGGLRGGGKGFYALDITAPDLAGSTAAEKEADLAGKVLWEFTDADMGFSFGKPQIGKTEAYGWVALLTSGYNNTDGKGYLYVVKIQDGSLIKKIPIDLASGSTYDQVGLANVIGVIDFTANASGQDNALLKYVYGGDLNGNLWRFNIRDADKANWSVKKLAANLNGAGASSKAPITAAPDVALINTPGPFPSYQNAADLKTQRLMVFVGNGKLLHGDDFSSNDNDNGFYAIADEDDALVIGEGACASLGCLVQDGLGQASSSLGLNNWGTTNNSNLTSWWVVDKHSFNWNGVQRVKRGWYIRFSETGGERMVYAPQVFNGKVLFTTTMKTDSRHGQAGTCEQAYSAMYNLSANKGGEETGYPSRVNLGFGIASGVSIIQLPDGSTFGTGNKKGAGEDGSENCKEGDGCDFRRPTDGNPPAVNGQLRRFGWREIYR